MEPKKPTCDDVITITKKFNSSVEGEVFFHWGVNSWNKPPKGLWPKDTVVFDKFSVESPMSAIDDKTYKIQIDMTRVDCEIEKIDFVLRNGDNWDNNEGQNYHIKVKE